MPLDSSDHPGQTVGARLRAARLAKRYTQNQLAQPDFSVSYISAIERGQIQPSLRALEIFAQRLGINSTHLFPQYGGISSRQVEESSGLTDEERMLLLEAQIELHQGNAARVIALLRPLLLKEGEPSLRVFVQYVLGWAYLERGYAQESEYTLAEAVHMVQGAADPLFPRILCLQGVVALTLHKAEEAITFLRASLAALQQWPAQNGDAFFQAQLSLHLGQAYTYLEQFAPALELFQQASTLLQAQKRTAQPLHAPSQSFLAFPLESAEQFLIALAHYKRQHADFQAWQAALQCEIQHFLGRALLKSQPDVTYEYLLKEASAHQHPLVRASARVHLAAWSFMYTENLGQVASYLSDAMALAEPFGESLIRADALLLQGRLAYVQQAYEQGDHSFTSALAMFEHLHAFEELIEHLATYARLLEERGLIHKAIIYWKQAYEYRQKNRGFLLA